MTLNPEKICSYHNPLSSPLEHFGSLYMVAQNGDILSYKESLQREFRLGGQPSCISIEKDLNTVYIADMAHQAITIRQFGDNRSNETIEILIKDYQEQPLLGPNTIISSQSMNSLFFTDSGPFGETSLENPQGSVFMVDLDSADVKPVGLAVRCLAGPSGLALNHDEKILFVAETCNNRILRFVLTNQGVYFFSVYCTFNGRYGPTALAVSQTDLLYVARFEFSHISDFGIISAVNQSGTILENLIVPGCPEITGIIFSSLKSTLMYLTENTNDNKLIRVHIPLEDKEEEKKKKDKDGYKNK